ncbi:hypothetical protein BS50DRAFT_638813 [Corynespora cassiicola Philippines]|uniref:CHRD domain-containing protein n=1 Tax=Corynespora cassiicola Philippines TaxID=1448308 RepID=A0A2T2NA67_CORCC|nr:hypothetical protein BS50DRAFT_638813 [Corynespora cassiicola Philippines]
MHYFTTAIISALAATAAASPVASNGDHKWIKNPWKNGQVFQFDKTITVKADPNQVRNGTTPVPGQEGAKGVFKFGINVADNTICYNITLSGVTGDYQSPAITATHIHEAAKGASGPPRIAIPNPQGPDDRRISYGCLTGPFETGVLNNGTDTGTNFHVKEIVDNPTGFFADTHTVQFSLGAVRGQLC